MPRFGLLRERPEQPPRGYKAAFPMLAADHDRVGFRGMTLGAHTVYGAVDEARCIYGRRHACPSRLCSCGFYCMHAPSEALALTCATEYRGAVVLEVGVLGSYIRYEHGMRYQRQRVHRVSVGHCRCGGPSEAFTDAGTGISGWRTLAGTCASCAAGRADAVYFEEFSELAGGSLTAVCDTRIPPAPSHAPDFFAPVQPRSPRRTGRPLPVNGEDDLVPQLAAEAVLLQARLDWFQEQLARLTEPGP